MNLRKTWLWLEAEVPGGGSVAVAQALARNTTLTTLDLGYNRLGEDGGNAVAHALERNTTLTNLNLEDNDLGDVFAMAVARALEKNTTLTALNLSRNSVGEHGGIAVARALVLLEEKEKGVAAADSEAVDGEDETTSHPWQKVLRHLK